MIHSLQAAQQQLLAGGETEQRLLARVAQAEHQLAREREAHEAETTSTERRAADAVAARVTPQGGVCWWRAFEQ